MFNLILLVIFAIGFGYFATLNTLTVPLTFGFYSFHSLPLYVVIGVSLLAGLVLSWLISLLGSLSNSIAMYGKEKEINTDKATIHAMTKQTNDLQIENAGLKGELKNEPFDDTSL